MKCKCCKKKPEDLLEYVSAANDAGMTLSEYVEKEEGTYNPETEEFYCTRCYVKLGCPLGIA